MKGMERSSAVKAPDGGDENGDELCPSQIAV
jgi:hypothetical protein